MPKIPFYDNHNKDDYNHFTNNYHPESFDLINYYQDFENTDNKTEESTENVQKESNVLDQYNNINSNDIYHNENPDI